MRKAAAVALVAAALEVVLVPELGLVVQVLVVRGQVAQVLVAQLARAQAPGVAALQRPTPLSPERRAAPRTPAQQ